jgi:hypothetical protein
MVRNQCATKDKALKSEFDSSVSSSTALGVKSICNKPKDRAYNPALKKIRDVDVQQNQNSRSQDTSENLL